MAFGMVIGGLLAALAKAAAAAPAVGAAKAAGAGALAAGAAKAGTAATAAPAATPAATVATAAPAAAPAAASAAAPTGGGAFSFGAPAGSATPAASGLTVPQATTNFLTGNFTTNVSSVAEAVTNTAPTFLDKLAAFGTEFGQDALRGSIVGGIQGGIRGNQNPAIGTTRGVTYGALGGGVSGGVAGGLGALGSENLGMSQALQGFSQSGTPAQSFGQQLASGARDLFIGEQPIQSILGSEAPGTRRGVIPNLVRRVDLNIPIGKRRRVKVRPFGPRGLSGRGIRVARGRR